MSTADRPVVIFGIGQLAVLTHYYAQELGREVGGFVVDDKYVDGTNFCGRPVVAFSQLHKQFDPGKFELLVTLGYKIMRARREVFDRLRGAGYKFANLVCKGARIAANAELGEGNIVFPNTTIEPFARVGDNNVIWSNCVICHDSAIGNHNYFAPSATVSGNCRIRDLSFFGSGVVLIDGVEIGDECYFRAGAVVLHDAAASGEFSGNPARRFGEIDPSKGVCVDTTRRRLREQA